ncbi:YeeE/YedE family protein [Sphingobacterium sp. HJSM2_6]|uniref:YeeE/YedE family protein n=1 Tax=Sphingobacterium sp. HJSM2_6 TaxID=3366264 RepID=UPI003BD5CB18
MDLVLGPWPWYVGGALVALVMVALVFLGKSFGFSSNFRNICSMLGAGKNCSFFDFDWKSQRWNLLFLVGAVVGGYLAANYLSVDQVPVLNPETIDDLKVLGFASAGTTYVPVEIFEIWSIKNVLLLAIAGLLIGFGTRYAGGCTSGHAISGLSNLQWPSLLAVIGFFIGGLIMVHLFFPLIF